MKIKKCALGLVAMLASVTALSACDLVSANNNGVIFTYTDATGNRTSYSADDLLSNYRTSGSSLATEFDKVYELFVRKYYDQMGGNKLASLKALAERDVIKDKQTAKNSASSTSSYEQEFEKILTSHSVKNVQELYEYHLYEEEKSDFQDAIYQNWATGDSAVNGLEALKDGSYTDSNKNTVSIMQASSDWGIENSGWLLDQMPYHYRHILIKLASGKTGEFTQDKIGESTDGKGGESTKLSRLIFALAGANYTSEVDAATKVRTTTITESKNRQSFGNLAAQYSEDSSGTPASSTHQGETSIVTKVMSSDFVPEFKLGSYAYETLFNTRETGTDYGSKNAYRIAPGLKKEAADYVSQATTTTPIPTTMIDTNQALENGTTVYDQIKNTGLGQIPFGAAVALADYADTIKDVNGNPVNESNEVFYPRNVIFNKYFNKHNICVVTPNAIMSNSNVTGVGADLASVSDVPNLATQTVSNQKYKGAKSSLYSALPGFSVDTTGTVAVADDNGVSENVLTNSEGQIVLAVRVSSSGYQGIHFIVVERSALSQFGLSKDSSGVYVENATQTAGVANNSQYFTTYLPDSSSYPSDTSGKLKTYVNYNNPTSEDLTTRSNNISTAIKGFNSALSTYQFQLLVEKKQIVFNDKDNEAIKALEDEIKLYSQEKRLSSRDTAFNTWSDNWKSYAEALANQEAERSLGKDTGLGKLLCEYTAVHYADATKDTLWNKGGACYYGTK